MSHVTETTVKGNLLYVGWHYMVNLCITFEKRSHTCSKDNMETQDWKKGTWLWLYQLWHWFITQCPVSVVSVDYIDRKQTFCTDYCSFQFSFSAFFRSYSRFDRVFHKWTLGTRGAGLCTPNDPHSSVKTLKTVRNVYWQNKTPTW